MTGTPIPTRRARRGLTLIELMVATLLAAILMVLISGVLRSVARHQKWVVQEAATAPPTSILADQLRRDLSNARQLESTPSALRLSGLLAEDPLSHLPVQRPAQVTYAVERVAGAPCLVRTVMQELEGGGRMTLRTPLWYGAAGIKTQRFDTPAVLLPEETVTVRSGQKRQTAQVNQMPARVEVTILDTGGHVLCRVHSVR